MLLNSFSYPFDKTVTHLKASPEVLRKICQIFSKVIMIQFYNTCFSILIINLMSKNRTSISLAISMLPLPILTHPKKCEVVKFIIKLIIFTINHTSLTFRHTSAMHQMGSQLYIQKQKIHEISFTMHR